MTHNQIKTDWRIVKSSNPKFGGAWEIETRLFEQISNPDGSIASEMVHNWQRHSPAATKKAALSRIMLLRERGETVSWSGPPIRLGLALISSC